MTPNILWICTDQQRYDTIRALGNEYIHTPNIDRLVQEGVAFTHAFCQSPICTPSRASFLTGMYPGSVHGCMNGNERWAEAAPLVTKLLADAGVDCGLSGKLHLAGAQGRVEPRPLDDGYRVFHWSHGSSTEWEPGQHAWGDWLRSQGHEQREFLEDPDNFPPELHQTTWCTDRAIEHIETASTPWLMSVNIFDPHVPFDPPQSYMQRYDPAALPGPLFRESDLQAQAALAGIDFQNPARRPEEFDATRIKAAYYAMIEVIDDNVGRMLDALERTGQRENTLIIFMSDHGEMLGDHGLVAKGCRFYEGLVRVPLIFSWPGQIESGLVSDALVELIDIAPTLLELAGIPAPALMQGRSLLPILRGAADPGQHRDFVRSEFYSALNSIERQQFTCSYATMLRDQRYKLVVYHDYEPGELFDLDKDPGEFDNLWDDPDYSNVRHTLMKRSFDALALAIDVGTPQVTRF